jgi:hypothetical protein
LHGLARSELLEPRDGVLGVFFDFHLTAAICGIISLLVADDKEIDAAELKRVMSGLSRRRWSVATKADRKRQGAAMAAGRRRARQHRKAKARKASKISPR